jgi:hypothetical protein
MKGPAPEIYVTAFEVSILIDGLSFSKFGTPQVPKLVWLDPEDPRLAARGLQPAINLARCSGTNPHCINANNCAGT